MPACLSIRFYRHRDTVDSSFVFPEKTGALRSQTTTFIMIYKGCEYTSVCVFLWFCRTKRKGQGCELVWNKKPVSLCVPHMKICTFVSLHISSCVLMFLALCELLNSLRSAGVVFQKKERGQILTLSLCYQLFQPVRQQAPPPLHVREAEGMVAKC